MDLREVNPRCLVLFLREQVQNPTPALWLVRRLSCGLGSRWVFYCPLMWQAANSLWECEHFFYKELVIQPLPFALNKLSDLFYEYSSPTFVGDTTVAGLISNNDEPHYREEFQKLIQGCSRNNLILSKVVADYRRFRTTEHASFQIHGEAVKHPVYSNLSWSVNTTPGAHNLLQGHNWKHPVTQCDSVVQ